jgi:hypothetical protein
MSKQTIMRFARPAAALLLMGLLTGCYYYPYYGYYPYGGYGYGYSGGSYAPYYPPGYYSPGYYRH